MPPAWVWLFSIRALSDLRLGGAKTRFAGAGGIEVRCDDSDRPLYLTAASMDPAAVARHVAARPRSRPLSRSPGQLEDYAHGGRRRTKVTTP